MKVTRHLYISGQVQGVGYRIYMEKRARAASVTGWVRNRQDGTVEAVVQGSPEAVDAIITWAWRGPPGATVTEVQVAEGTGEYESFETRPTA